MKLYHKLMIGAFGGLLPTLLLMYRLDYTDLLETAEAGLIVGGCIKTLLAAGFGAVMVYVHRTEENVYKLIQLGVAAPGLLSILVTDTRQTTPGIQQEIGVERTASISTVDQVGLSTILFSTAMAQNQQEWDVIGNGIRQSNGGTGGGSLKVEEFTGPEEGFVTQMVRGFTGALPEDRFYVVHSSYATEAEAQQVAKQQNARVFKGNDPQKPYNVVVAAQVDLKEAEQRNAIIKSPSNKIIEVR